MNAIVNKFLLAEDKFIPKIRLRQQEFTYIACVSFTKNKETVDSRYIYQSELDKHCFQYDMVYRGFKDLPRRTASDKILRDKAFNVVKNLKYHGYQRRLASMVYKYFDKKCALLACSKTLATTDKSASGGAIKNENMSSKELAEELHKPIIKKLEKGIVQSPFIANV